MSYQAANVLCEFISEQAARGVIVHDIVSMVGIGRDETIKIKEFSVIDRARFCKVIDKNRALKINIDISKAAKLAEIIPTFTLAQQRQLKERFNRYIKGKEESIQVKLVDNFIAELAANIYKITSMGVKRNTHELISSALIRAIDNMPGYLVPIFRCCLILENVASIDVNPGLLVKSLAVAGKASKAESEVIELIKSGAGLIFINKYLPKFKLSVTQFRALRDIYLVEMPTSELTKEKQFEIFSEYQKFLNNKVDTISAYKTLRDKYNLTIDTLFLVVSSALQETKPTNINIEQLKKTLMA